MQKRTEFEAEVRIYFSVCRKERGGAKRMKITQKEVEKWFDVEEGDDNLFISKVRATTIEEAWEKTLCKWALITEVGKRTLQTVKTCGLCDLFSDNLTKTECEDCPVSVYTCEKACHGTPVYELNTTSEFMFLLSLYEWWKEEKRHEASL